MIKSHPLIRTLLIATVLQSCVGIGVVGSQRYGRELGDVFFGVSQPIHTQELADLWGEPSEVRRAPDGSEEWTYKSDLRWGGLVLCVVIPIPLMLPVGRESTTLSIVDGVVVSAEKLAELTTLYVAGVVPGICYDFGVGVYHR